MAYCYQLFNNKGVLIYVGSTVHIKARIARHKSQIPNIDSYSFEKFTNIEMAVEREEELFFKFSPKHNKKAPCKPRIANKKSRKSFTTMLNADLRKRLKVAAASSDNAFTVADLIEKYVSEGLDENN